MQGLIGELWIKTWIASYFLYDISEYLHLQIAN